MPLKCLSVAGDARVLRKSNVSRDQPPFPPLTDQEIRDGFAGANVLPPTLSLPEAASLVKLRPQTLKRKVSEGQYKVSVVREKPLRFWRDRLVAEVMR
jgi:hypothetical protein